MVPLNSPSHFKHGLKTTATPPSSDSVIMLYLINGGIATGIEMGEEEHVTIKHTSLEVLLLSVFQRFCLFLRQGLL